MMKRLHAPMILIGVFAAASTARAAGQTADVQQPEETPASCTWNLADIFESVGAWEAEFAAMEKRIAELAARKGSLNRDAETLLDVLDSASKMHMRVDKLAHYASLTRDLDTRNNNAQALDSRASALFTKFHEAAAWIEPELLQIPKETLDEWTAESDGLGVYRHFFDDLHRRKKHTLSEREEELLAMAGRIAQTPYLAYSRLANADLKFTTIKDADGNPLELSAARYLPLLQSPDRRVRRDAFTGILQAYLDYRNTSAALLAGLVETHVFFARARRYDSCLQAALDRDNLPPEVFTNLIDTINANTGVLHRYMDLRKKVLKLDELHFYDTFVPLVTDVEIKMTYDECVQTVTAALAPLGEEYVNTVSHGFASRWVDVYESRGKRPGAYSACTYYLPHPFILMNFTHAYDDSFTLAHEMGHAMHSYYSIKNQPIVNSQYSGFCAEVASTINEIILQDFMLRKYPDPEQQLYIVNQAIENMRRTVWTQVMFAEFEKTIHELTENGQALTADRMGDVFRDIVKHYYGPALTLDPQVDGYWLRIPHFYYNFYVFKYATSYCAAANLWRRVKAGDEQAHDRFLSFLKAGGSDYPLDLLAATGVDMTTPAYVEDGVKRFAEMVDRMEELLRSLDRL